MRGKWPLPEFLLGALLTLALLAAGFAIGSSWIASRPAMERPTNQQASQSSAEKKPPVSPWDDPITAANILIAFFTFCLVVTGYYQNRGLKRANKIAHLAADAAKASADHIPNVERAYVFIDPELRGRGASKIQFDYHIFNVGKTPAIIRSLEVNAAVLRDPPDNTTHTPTETLNDQIVLVTEARWPFPGKRPKDCTWDAADSDDLVSRQIYVWFWGSIIYDDVFGNERVTRFRWKIKDWEKSRFHADGGKPYNERT